MYFSIGLLSVVGSLARTYRHKLVMTISVVVGSWQSIINWKMVVGVEHGRDRERG
jgi:hypothetical protein